MASFDPLASSQVTVDPALKPKPSKEHQQAWQWAFERFLAAGATEEQAAAEATRYVALHPTISGAAPPAAPAAPTPAAPVSPRDAMEADLYAKGYSDDEARKQADMQAEMRAEREAKQLGLDIDDAGYSRSSQPGPRDISGRAAPGSQFASVEEARNYEYRAPTQQPGMFEPSQRDEAERLRGRVPVYNPDGSVSYRTAFVPGVGDTTVVPGAPGRLGPRQDLYDDRDGTGPYRVQSGVQGPLGPMDVLVPTDETRAKAAEIRKKASERQAERNPYSAQNLPSVKERMQRFQAQIQLGGGHLSPQAIQLETMLNGMTPEQRQRALQYMAPGGALAAQVDARNLEAAAGLARNAVVGVLGQAGGNNPAAQAAVEAGLPLEQQVQLTRDRNGGTLPANSPAGVALLKQIENDVIGPFATEAEVDQAVRQAVAAGIPLADAEAHFAPRRWKKKPAAAAAPGEEPAKPRAPGRGGSRTRPRKPGDARPRE